MSSSKVGSAKRARDEEDDTRAAPSATRVTSPSTATHADELRRTLALEAAARKFMEAVAPMATKLGDVPCMEEWRQDLGKHPLAQCVLREVLVTVTTGLLEAYNRCAASEAGDVAAAAPSTGGASPEDIAARTTELRKRLPSWVYVANAQVLPGELATCCKQVIESTTHVHFQPIGTGATAVLHGCTHLGPWTARLECTVALALTLEYLYFEVMELATNCARGTRRPVVEMSDVIRAMANDAELSQLLVGTAEGCISRAYAAVDMPVKVRRSKTENDYYLQLLLDEDVFLIRQEQPWRYSVGAWMKGICGDPLFNLVHATPLLKFGKVDEIEYMGQVESFLVELRDGGGTAHTLHVRYNDGDADANTGLFGWVDGPTGPWLRMCGGAAGDCGTYVQAMPAALEAFEPHDEDFWSKEALKDYLPDDMIFGESENTYHTHTQVEHILMVVVSMLRTHPGHAFAWLTPYRQRVGVMRSLLRVISNKGKAENKGKAAAEQQFILPTRALAIISEFAPANLAVLHWQRQHLFETGASLEEVANIGISGDKSRWPYFDSEVLTAAEDKARWESARASPLRVRTAAELKAAHEADSRLVKTHTGMAELVVPWAVPDRMDLWDSTWEREPNAHAFQHLWATSAASTGSPDGGSSDSTNPRARALAAPGIWSAGADAPTSGGTGAGAGAGAGAGSA